MTTKLLAFLAATMVAVLGVAVPAEAHRTHHVLAGEMYLDINPALLTGESDVSWAGTWDVGDGEVYDIVFFSIEPPTPIGETGWVHWVEDVALYDRGVVERDATGTVLPFDREAYVMYGHDRGIGNAELEVSLAVGTVTGVNPRNDDFHHVRSSTVGNRLGFTGAPNADMTVFTGTFWVRGVR